MDLGYHSLVLGRWLGEVWVRRIITYILWALGLGWLVIWGISALAQDSMPTGVVWAFLSLVIWWLVGGEAKEDSAKDN